MLAWFKGADKVMDQVPWVDSGVANVWLDSRCIHLADLLRESIENVFVSEEIVSLVAGDWVLYD